jgi:hypothetical protein
MAEPVKPANNSIAFAVTSMVTGIVGLILGVFFWLSLPLAAVAITFGALGMRRPIGKGMAIAGLVTGSVAALIGLCIIMLALIAANTPTYYTY